MKTITRNAAWLGLLILALPASVHAQRGAGPRQGGGVGNPVAPIINMRRQLNLTSRQLVQLDSIERTLLQRNRAVQERIRTGVDSIRPLRRPLTDEQRQALQTRADSARTLRREIQRNDSVARAAVMRVLTDSQRVQVRVRQAAARGFAMGRASAMRGQRQPGQRGQMVPPAARGRIGQRFMQPGMGPMGPQGRMGMPGPRGGQLGPGQMGGRPGRMGPPDPADPMADSAVTPRRRGMMGQGMVPPPPARRPPPDSGR